MIDFKKKIVVKVYINIVENVIKKKNTKCVTTSTIFKQPKYINIKKIDLIINKKVNLKRLFR